MRYMFPRFPGGLAKAVTFSYDDGCPEDVRLANLFTKYGLKGTFNMNVAKNSTNGITIEQVKEHILDKGHEVAVHGYNHRANGVISVVDGIRDVLECRLNLEKTYGKIIRGMAYPDTGIHTFANGTTYEKVKQYLTELGIVYSRTLGEDSNSFAVPDDWHCWKPTCHHDHGSVFKWIDEFFALDLSANIYLPRRAPRIFYIWGHSFEFERKNNWEQIEKICEKISRNPDVWYATNIEIYDYLKAYDSLLHSADGNIIYNPTAERIWFVADSKDYVINPGETLYL
ncbi:MAG: polysaccharide deacetylase family protein [Clostridia bacterium]|nr:polysaccharide deacetylase family protein [Clostridia bacterium]